MDLMEEGVLKVTGPLERDAVFRKIDEDELRLFTDLLDAALRLSGSSKMRYCYRLYRDEFMLARGRDDEAEFQVLPFVERSSVVEFIKGWFMDHKVRVRVSAEYGYGYSITNRGEPGEICTVAPVRFRYGK